MNLREFVGELWRGRAIITVCAGVVSVATLAYALLATEIFRSQALVQPKEEQRTGASLIASQFGGLADLAGISIGGGGDRAVAIATLKSRVLIETFIREKELLPKLYESKWNESEGGWSDPDRAPTVWEAYNDFVKDILIVTEDKKSGLLTVAIEWRDPEEARAWVTELVARANALLKQEALREGERNLAYLEGQAKSIGQVELRQAVFSLVEAELKKMMLANAGEEFALKTVDPAVMPTKRTRPKRALICFVGFGVGLFLGVVMALSAREWHKSNA